MADLALIKRVAALPAEELEAVEDAIVELKNGEDGTRHHALDSRRPEQHREATRSEC